jgi:hypothetical protein
MKTKSILFLFVLLVCSCVGELPDEELTMIKTPYTGKAIRMDGCYVSDPYELNVYCGYCFFYSNGVYFALSDKLNISNINNFTSGIDNRRNDKSSWGLFQIGNNSIKVQVWKMSDVSPQFIVQNRTYKIINDSTLFSDVLSNGDITYYHFKHFTLRPDSTNLFIK